MFRKLLETKTSVEESTTKYYHHVGKRPYDHPMIIAFAKP
jgi:nuclear transport factor 2 (NTF2) superfamily protein